MRFPMDEVDGDKVLGYFNGILKGNASLVSGIHGGALCIDGQWGPHVTYGTLNTDGCFFDPDQCDQAITFSLWLLLQEMPLVGTVFNNGGCAEQMKPLTPPGLGYCIFSVYDSIGFQVRAINGNYVYSYNLKQQVTSVWNSFIITYVSGEIKVFVNGCIGEPDSSKYNCLYSMAHPGNSTFYIGNLPGTHRRAHATIDELMVWYTILTEDEIWNLHVQGGVAWFVKQ